MVEAFFSPLLSRTSDPCTPCSLVGTHKGYGFAGHRQLALLRNPRTLNRDRRRQTSMTVDAERVPRAEGRPSSSAAAPSRNPVPEEWSKLHLLLVPD